MTTSPPPAPRRQFHVYVVELDHRALGASQPCVYVGETGLTRPERYARHRAGGRTAARVVHRHGVRLRPDLSARWGPYTTRAGAVTAEANLAAALRATGYRVFGGQGHTFTHNAAASNAAGQATSGAVSRVAAGAHRPRPQSATAGQTTAMPPRARSSREGPHDAHL